MSRATRLAVALAVALVLPFPGPHVDRWIPMVWAVSNEDAWHAPVSFFALAGVILVVYTGVVFGVLSLVTAVRRR